jgi:hypothetical protein
MRRDEDRSTRADPKRLIAVTATLVAAWFVAGVFELRTPPRLADRVTWRPPQEARSVAATATKPLLLFFADEQRLSARLEREIFGDRSLGPRIDQSYVVTRVGDRRSAGRENTADVAALVRQFAIAECPVLVVVPRSGEPRTFVRYPARQRVIAFLFPQEAGGPPRH